MVRRPAGSSLRPLVTVPLALVALLSVEARARADDSAADGRARARERLGELATKGTFEIVGGAIALGAGGALTTAGLWPCESGDCSTRGLGAAVGVPIAAAGAFFVLSGARDRSNASSLGDAVESDASGAAAEAESARIAARAKTEMLVGSLVTIAGLGGLVTSLVLAKGCGASCGPATGAGIAGGVVSAAGLSVVTLGVSDRRAAEVPLGMPVMPVASPSSIGVATTFAF